MGRQCKTDIITTRLSAQQLSSSALCTPQQLVAWMGAMQAQDFNMAKWAIGIRLPGATNTLIENAFNKGEIIRTHVLRPTWHFVAPQDIRWMLPLTAAKIGASLKARDKSLELTPAFYSKGFKILEKTLTGNNHCTREALTAAFDAHKLPINTQQLYHVMMRAELAGLVCSGALSGKQHTYAWLDERVPATKPIGKDEALAKLARIYFTSHGPATLADFTWWSGLSVSDARQGLEALKTDFFCEKIDNQQYWFPHAVGRDTGQNTLVHLLPAFDEYIIAYRDRTAVLPATHHGKAISSNGVFRPTIMHNGQVIGLWKKGATKSNPVAADFFAPASKTIQALVDKSVKEFSLFLTTN